MHSTDSVSECSDYTCGFVPKFTWGLAIAIVILSLLATMTMPSANISSSKSGVEEALEQAIESNQNLLPSSLPSAEPAANPAPADSAI